MRTFFYDCLGGSGVKGVAFARVPLFDCQQICSLFPLLRAFSPKNINFAEIYGRRSVLGCVDVVIFVF